MIDRVIYEFSLEIMRFDGELGEKRSAQVLLSYFIVTEYKTGFVFKEYKLQKQKESNVVIWIYI